jgi:hypothetical protein
MKDLNVRPKTLKLVELRAGNTMEATGMHIKTSLRFHLTPLRIGIIKNTTKNRHWRRCGEKGTLIHCWWK